MTISRYLTSALILSTLTACGDKTEKGAHYSENMKQHDSASKEDNQALSEPGFPATEETPDTSEETSIDPNRIVFSSTFQGDILKDKIKFIYAPDVVGSRQQVAATDTLFYNRIKDDLEKITENPVNLLAEQRYGDGQKSLFTQTISSPTDNTKDLKHNFFGEIVRAAFKLTNVSITPHARTHSSALIRSM